jgi:glucose-1-phosphate adenylyltransferase
VIFDNCDIGRRAKLHRCILEKNVSIPADAVIGFDHAEDAKHYHVTESGIVVISGKRTPVSLTTINL